MTTPKLSSPPALALLCALTLSLAACECPDGRWNDGHGGGSSYGTTHDPNWPPPTPPNPSGDDPYLPVRDAGAVTSPTRDAGAPDTGSVTPPTRDAGAPDTGTPAPHDAGLPDGRVCPTNSCGSAPVCQFDNQCGPGGRCRNGGCEHGCSSVEDCGTGQTCTHGVCVTPATSGGQCVYDRDCGTSATCINGRCQARCTSTVPCASYHDVCVAGVCQPDVSPQPQCRASTECQAGDECVNAVCRTPCMTDAQCCDGSSGSTCREGVCVTDHEAAPQCRQGIECGGGHSCIDAVCVAE